MYSTLPINFIPFHTEPPIQYFKSLLHTPVDTIVDDYGPPFSLSFFLCF